MRKLIVLLLALSSATFALAADAATPKTTLIKAGHFVDVVAGDVKSNVGILVVGQRVQQVGPIADMQKAAPSDAEVIDLSNATVLPGLIDCHTHLMANASHQDDIWAFRTSPFDAAYVATVNARKTLEAGFTTVRDVGSWPFGMVDLRKAVDQGLLPGPHIVASGPGISITGGHGDLNGFWPGVSVALYPQERDFQMADGPDQVRHVVREQLKYGVDVVKILATGGVLSLSDKPGAPQFTEAELRAAAEEAHAGGRKIAAHAHGPEGIKNAIRAGIDSIEHASLVDDEGIALAKQHGTYFVMDIYNDDFILQEAPKFGLNPEKVEKEKMVGRTQRENFAKAFKAGVKMAFGTDAGVYPHGDNARQFKYMVKFGMTPMQAIQAATLNASDLIDRKKDVGSIEAGKFADIVAVNGDPLADVTILEHIAFVMKSGEVYKNTTK